MENKIYSYNDIEDLGYLEGLNIEDRVIVARKMIEMSSLKIIEKHKFYLFASIRRMHTYLSTANSNTNFETLNVNEFTSYLLERLYLIDELREVFPYTDIEAVLLVICIEDYLKERKKSKKFYIPS